ncbi:MAG: acetylxylan esterase [Bryobacterales bacterium]|nr:acetylxylan esterase [Bryobacterales bacterium]
MVHEYFVRRVREAEAESLRLKSTIRTAGDAERYLASIKERIRLAMGPMPERTPLNARVTGTVERDTYRIEKVIFESRPGFLVTANLYVPKGRSFPLPGVVGSCGHSVNGKCGETYQAFSQGLARQGYVVLIFDPIGQGERFQYTDAQLQPRRGTGTREHLYAGNQQVLTGEFFGGWRAWDGIRALDYLLTRPEVDRRHVGITGNSGGGTMSTWLCGLEERWTMAAPSCFVTTFRRNLENELPADTEQCPPRAIALGLDHDDFIAAMAPKPVILLGKERDYFDARGFEESYWRLKRLWGMLGKEENLAKFMGPTPHGYSQENREAMYGWFNRVTGVAQGSAEPNLTIEKDETLWCTPRGQVAGLQSKPLYSFTRGRSEELRAKRRPLVGAALREAVAGTLRLPRREGAPDFRILRPFQKRGYPEAFATPYAVETEPGIQALVYRLSAERHDSRPARGMKRAVLYVSHRSADTELREEPLVREIHKAERGVPFYACDVRGIGESQPDTCGENSFESPYGSDYFYAAHALMLHFPYPGQRTHDILRVLDWLAGYEHEEIHLVAKGWGAIPGAFAALLSPMVRQVTLKNALTSYSEVAESEEYGWRLSSLVPGVLESFDLPDVYRELESKQLRQAEPLGARA